MKQLLFPIIILSGLLLLVGCDSSSNSSTPQYTVTLAPSPAEGGSVSAAEQVYDEGSVATIVATPAGEWVFSRWEGDFGGTSSTSTLTVDSDKNITAIFEKKNYALKVNTSGEGTVDEQVVQAKSTDYESGTLVELTASPAVGWEFKEWAGAIADTANPVQLTIDDPKQVTAIFAEISTSYTVTLTPSPFEGGSVSAASQMYEEGTVATISATPASEWEFVRWEGDFSGTSSTSTLTVDEDKNIMAIFEKKNYALTVNTSGEGTVDEQIVQAKSTDYASGTVVELTATPAEGWGFVKWEGAISGNTNPVQVNVEGDRQVTAVFSPFYLAPNGVTIKCGAAEVGNQAIINGTLYTKRTQAQINVSNAASTCTTGVIDMSNLFNDATSFNEDISHWDVSSVTDMTLMFGDLTSFNRDLSSWDVSSVTDMSGMFRFTTSFNVDLNSWDVSSVTDMGGMFRGASSFNQNLNSWDVSSVTDMVGMFREAISFNGNLSSWDVSLVTNMFAMFNATSFNQNISGWCVTNFLSEPSNFSSSSPLTNDNKPVWGTCPN